MYDRPQARTEGILTELVDDDLVVYDVMSQTAHSLSSETASVWEICDGKRSVRQIADELSVEPAMVARAVAELGECSLLDDGPLALASVGISRREAAKKLARVGGAALVAPLIYSVAVPVAAAAASTCSVATGVQMPALAYPAACTATPGNYGTSTPNASFPASDCCMSGACYMSTNSGTRYCIAAGDTCVRGGQSCTVATQCCDTSASCNGNPNTCSK